MTADHSGRLLDVTHSASDPALTPVSNDLDWHSANDSGMAFAAADDWRSAHTAFRTALACAPAYREAPATHAVLLGNLAQSRFRCGDHAGAIETARGALVARLISCDGETDAPMARSRADLAVYLAAGGQHEEARRTLAQARAALEARFGEHDSRLISILENEARMAIASGAAAAAAAPLSRLQTILAASGEDSSRLGPLFAHVDAVHGDGDVFGRVDGDVVIDGAVRDREPAFDSADEFDLVDDAAHAPFQTPSAERIREAGLIEPGSHRTPVALLRTHPLGFEVQYGVPQDVTTPQ